ncbi:hypothetical protein AJ80_06227 [Polytolypa hystricis UAMH7299]|uniref:Uncharacterized protein n=1 Tax=Polytolypa hystricis (strain UAMH7299) TaxID=1447883 RepID=A0A2B7XYM2_POLH7|nr:hypothetical protein AJ80_06227 [Polytolypa hystricis UAMH7299]
MAASKADADVIFNRANVALARSQRLIASWLPAKTAEELTDTKTEEELRREEDEIFTAVPEKLGLGAPLPQKQADGSFNRTELSSNDKLRQQLLGRNYRKVMANASRPPVAPKNSIQASTQTTSQDAESDDEEEGRSSLGKNKRQRSSAQGSRAASETDTQDTNNSDQVRGSRGKKRGTYLDELLSQRSKKKKKKAKQGEKAPPSLSG